MCKLHGRLQIEGLETPYEERKTEKLPPGRGKMRIND